MIGIKFGLVFLLYLAALSNNCLSNELVGKWKSDAEKTLSTMRDNEEVTEQARVTFEDDLFGKLVAEYTLSGVRFYYEDDSENVEGMKVFRPYSILRQSNSEIVIRYLDQLTDEFIERVLHLENNCYYVLVSKWKFREYFCRMD